MEYVFLILLLVILALLAFIFWRGQGKKEDAQGLVLLQN
jgi:preprotein translocase subunit YajC